MKKALLLILLFPLTILSQTQIGDDIIGEFEGDILGSSVAISEDGSFLIAGSVSNSNNGASSGRAQVFENVNNTWIQLGDDINGDGPGSDLGRDVAISEDGTIIAVGASGDDNERGSVRVFENSNGSWVQIGDEIVGINPNGRFGSTVNLSPNGDILAVGAPTSADNQGSAHIFENQGGVWTQLGDDINGDVVDGLFGNGIDISDDGLVLAIGGDGFEGTGTLRIFEYIAGSWSLGQTIFGETTLDRLGSNINISGDGTKIAVSAIGNETNGLVAGAVRIYENISGTWVKTGDLFGDNLLDQFGASVSMSSSGDVIGVGSFGPENVRIFQNINNNWVELATISGPANSFFGLQSKVSSDGLSIAIGAQSFDGSGFNRGLVRAYDLEDIVTLSVDDVQENSFVLFPNPTSGVLTVKMNNNNQLEEGFVYNSLGQELLSFVTNVIDLSSLSGGVYYIEVVSNNKRSVKTVILN